MSDTTIDNVTAEIGFAAGDVYRYLFDNGNTSVSKIAKALKIPQRQVDQAVGWLAREQKVRFIRSKRTTLISLH